jgi:hypothetical protein
MVQSIGSLSKKKADSIVPVTAVVMVVSLVLGLVCGCGHHAVKFVCDGAAGVLMTAFVYVMVLFVGALVSAWILGMLWFVSLLAHLFKSV